MLNKTAAMKQLDEKGIEYEAYQVELKEFVSGVHQAEVTGVDPETMFKSLVVKSKDDKVIMCLLPVSYQLDIKKAGAYIGAKKLHFIKEEELLELTGYHHGETSPLGCKNPLPVIVHESALKHDIIIINGGGIGIEIEIEPKKLTEACDAVFLDIAK